MSETNRSATTLPMRCPSVGRNADWPKSLLFYFDRVPSDDQMRYLHEVMQRACACMPLPRSVAREGYRAFAAGVAYEDCPYRYTGAPGSDWWKWTTAWTLAKRRAEGPPTEQAEKST